METLMMADEVHLQNSVDVLSLETVAALMS